MSTETFTSGNQKHAPKSPRLTVQARSHNHPRTSATSLLVEDDMTNTGCDWEAVGRSLWGVPAVAARPTSAGDRAMGVSPPSEDLPNKQTRMGTNRRDSITRTDMGKDRGGQLRADAAGADRQKVHGTCVKHRPPCRPASMLARAPENSSAPASPAANRFTHATRDTHRILSVRALILRRVLTNNDP